jgi:hypothetical protein
MLTKYNIKSVTLPYRKIASYLPPVKDAIGLKTPEYTGSHVSAVWSTLDRVVSPSTYAVTLNLPMTTKVAQPFNVLNGN